MLQTYNTQFALPIGITEFDVSSSDKQQQADYLRDYLTMSFSQAGVDEFINWGFWSGLHYLPDAALYDLDFSVRPNGQVYEDLVFGNWWTDTRATTRNGIVNSEVFKGNYQITVTFGGQTTTKTLSEFNADGATTIAMPVATIANRRAFYNNATGANLSSSGSAENAIASDKNALIPGGTSVYANYTNYALGLNGVIVDINDLPATTTDSQILASLQFAQWNSISATGFDVLPAAAIPLATIVPGNVGVGGSARVKITFPDGTLQNTWLRVTVVANTQTALAADDVFYFGNVIGEMNVGNTGNRLRVNGQDIQQILSNQSPGNNSAVVTNIYDVNRDGRVNGQDRIVLLSNQQAGGIVVPITVTALKVPFGPEISLGELGSSGDDLEPSAAALNSFGPAPSIAVAAGFKNSTVTAIQIELKLAPFRIPLWSTPFSTITTAPRTSSVTSPISSTIAETPDDKKSSRLEALDLFFASL